jgi:hypothetical protein
MHPLDRHRQRDRHRSPHLGRVVRGGFVALLGALATSPPLDAAPLDTYIGHPRLLFTPGDLPALRAKLADGGEDDVAYADTKFWCDLVIGVPPSVLLQTWEGFNSMPQLGLTAWIEADGEPYKATARSMALEIARNRPPSNDEFTTALRLYVMTLGYDMAFDTATPAERAEIRAAMRTFLDWMPPHFNFYAQAYNPYTSNHGMTVGTAMGMAAVALWDDVTPAGRDTLQAQLDFADTLVDKVLTDIFAADGAYREGVLYVGWVMRVGIPWFEARKRFDGTDLSADPRLERSLDWLCYEITPDGHGRTNNLNDSAWTTRPLALHNTLLEWAQTRWSSPLSRYLHTHVSGSFGYNYGVYADRVATAMWNRPLPIVNPSTVLPSGKLFPERGLYYYRSGWKTGLTGTETVFSLFSGRFFGGHAQEDQNQITFAALGERWLTDCGPVGSTATPKQTESHNLVLVDGRGQHNAGNSIGTDGDIPTALISGFADYVRADAMAAYATYSPFNAAGHPFTFSDWSWGYDGGNPLERAGRLVLVFKGPEVAPWVLVGDDMRKDGSTHAWDWLLHTDQAHGIDLTTDPARVTAAFSAMDVYFAHPRPAALSLSWAPYASGGVDPNTRRIVASTQAVEPRYCVALVPHPNSAGIPTYSSVDDGNATTVALDWGAVRDVAVFSPRATPVSGEIGTDGRMAAVRQAGGSVRGWILGEGTSLDHGGRSLAVLGEPACMAWDGESVHVSSATVPFAAWAPGTGRVLGPSGEIPFRVDGDYLRNVGPTDLQSFPAIGLTFEPPQPNPIRTATLLRFRVPASGYVQLRIHDARGTRLATLADTKLTSGTHQYTWDARDRSGRRLASGIYFAVLETPGARLTRKLVVMP